MGKHKVAVFASGVGSNFQQIARAAERGKIPASVELLVCDRTCAPVIAKARRAGIDTLVVERSAFPTKRSFEEKIVSACLERGVEWIFLAGYMRLVGESMLRAFPERIVNIHPSLLPSFPGLDAVGQALRAGVKITGVTIHYVDQGMDTGPIIAQMPVPVKTGDTVETLTERIQRTEHELYPKIIAKLLRK